MRNEIAKVVVCTIIGGLFLLGSYACESKVGKNGTEEAKPKPKAERPTDAQRPEKRQQEVRPPARPLETIQGIVYLSGNEPFVHLALEALDGKVYYLSGAKGEELRHLQNRMVRVIGYLHPGPATDSDRDTVEVVGFEVVHSEGD